MFLVVNPVIRGLESTQPPFRSAADDDPRQLRTRQSTTTRMDGATEHVRTAGTRDKNTPGRPMRCVAS
jgi:hypothetical protein